MDQKAEKASRHVLVCCNKGPRNYISEGMKTNILIRSAEWEQNCFFSSYLDKLKTIVCGVFCLPLICHFITFCCGQTETLSLRVPLFLFCYFPCLHNQPLSLCAGVFSSKCSGSHTILTVLQ